MPLSPIGKIVIGLGSNLGNCIGNLREAVGRLEERFGTTVLASSVYRSEPVELLEQPWFYNQVVIFDSGGVPLPSTLLADLKTIEHQMGRSDGVRYGPRLIDLDLLFYEDWVLETTSLIIPHPKIAQRSFVLLPMAEIAPDYIHPRLGITIGEMINQNRAGLTSCEPLRF
jgi:2-amino-4-hydroxy-6-hydroxymethyldihydropteridine diphosphokinase